MTNSEESFRDGIRLTGMMKTFCIVALLWVVSAPAQDASQPKANHKYLKAFPKAAGGMSRFVICLLYTSPSPRDATLSRMPSSA